MTSLIILACRICIAVAQEIIDHLDKPVYGPTLHWKETHV